MWLLGRDSMLPASVIAHQPAILASMVELSSEHAKRLVVYSQGLSKSNMFGRGAAAMLPCIQQLGYVQIDTISVINRAHHHTLWTRVPTACKSQLDVLQRERKVFEYWSHAAAYLPIDDYRFCLPYMRAIASGQKHWRTPNLKVMKLVLDRIRSEGSLKARDFETDKHQTKSFWGGTKPAKIALEQLFIEGQIMVCHRQGFQKVFDLTERVLPSGLDLRVPTTEQFCRYLIDRTIQSQGIAGDAEIGYLRRGIKPDLKKQLAQMALDGEVVPVSIPGNPTTYYSRPAIVEQASSIRVTKNVHLLSPFDNLVIQRKRTAQIFNYDYQIECYVPEAKRVFGYFCLPILFGADFVGRMDPKADRKKRLLLIRNLVIEKEIFPIEPFVRRLAKKIHEFATFNECETISVESCNHRKIKTALKRELNRLRG